MIGGFLLIYGVVWSCSNLFSFRKVDNLKDVLSTNFAGDGIELAVEFKKGKSHNNPLMAIWIEDTLGNFIQTSCQPALVYSAEIDQNQPKVKYVMEPIGHSHYSGKDGNLCTDLGTITTALEITEEIVVILK